jgi:hypothetical protein
MKSRYLAVVLASIVLLGCEGTARVSSPQLRGRVVDAATGAPIEGAIVHARWRAQVVPSGFTGHFSRSICYHAEGAVSDAKGNFRLQAWQKELVQKVDQQAFGVSAYKLGYKLVATAGAAADPTVQLPELVVTLAAFSGSEDEQIEELERHARSCVGAGSSERNLYPLMEALYRDARAMPASARQQEYVRGLRRRAADVWVGWEPGPAADLHEQKVDEFLRENLK